MQLTELELKVMRALWNIDGAGTVNKILEAWLERKRPGYTTVLKILQILEKKGAVRHRRRGKAYVYVTKVSRDDSLRGLLGKVTTDFFGGNKVALASSLIQDAEFTPDELGRLRELIDKQEREAKHG